MSATLASQKADDQDTAAQVKALRQTGCKRIFEKKASGGRWDRPELHKALGQLREGDVLVVWKLDRLSRSLKDLIHSMVQVHEHRGGGYYDLRGPHRYANAWQLGRIETSMIRERTRVGLAAFQIEPSPAARSSSSSPRRL